MMITNGKKSWQWLLWSCLAAFCLVCSGCVTYDRAYVTRVDHLPQFSSIVVSGSAWVELSEGAPSISYSALQKNLVTVKSEVVGDTLYISGNLSTPNSIMLRAPGKNLTSITARHHARLSSKNITARNLKVTVSGSAVVSLDGVFGVTQVVQHGSGTVDIKWIDSPQLVVEGESSGRISLSGVVQQFVARLVGGAYLDARYLRAERATVLVTHHARADVWALRSLNAYADQKGDVYYYKRPQKLTKVTQGSGNVLFFEELR